MYPIKFLIDSHYFPFSYQNIKIHDDLGNSFIYGDHNFILIYYFMFQVCIFLHFITNILNFH